MPRCNFKALSSKPQRSRPAKTSVALFSHLHKPEATMLLQPTPHHQNASLSSTISYSLPLSWKNPHCGIRETVIYRKLPITCSISKIHGYGTLDYDRKSFTKWNSIHRRISLMENPELGAGTVLNQMEKDGKKLTRWGLCRVVKELRKFKRYKQALEVNLKFSGFFFTPSLV